MHIYRKILTYSGHVAFLCFCLMLSSCVSTSTFEAQVQKADSLQKALNGSINEKKDLLSKQAGNLAIIDDLQSEIRVLKQKIKILEEQLDQAKKASSDEIKSLLSQLEKAEEDLFARETKLRDLQALMKQRDSSMNALRESVEKSLLGFKDSGLEIEVKNGKVYVKMSNQLLFKSGSTSIDKRGREALQQLATVLAQQTEISIMIEGHTDNVPINSSRFADNWDLSVLRSTEVARILTIENGIDPKRIIASGRSEFIPISELNDPESRAKNRRTEIILSPKLDELLNLVK
ncbi:MAG: OmpA family protein [Candidatus Kapaibacteriota bacterium]